MIIERNYNDFNVGFIDREIELHMQERRTLRFTRNAVYLVATMLAAAIISGLLTPWAFLISFAAFAYGLIASHHALGNLKIIIAHLERRRAQAVYWRRFSLEFTSSLTLMQLSHWLENNAPGSCFATVDAFPNDSFWSAVTGLPRKTSFFVSFPDEDTRMLFRLTHL